MGGLSWWHWMIILGAFVLLFGAKKLPDAARGVGRSLRILKSEVSAMTDDDKNARDTNGETIPGPAVVAAPGPVAAPGLVANPGLVAAPGLVPNPAVVAAPGLVHNPVGVRTS